jgi:hypothetical protein
LGGGIHWEESWSPEESPIGGADGQQNNFYHFYVFEIRALEERSFERLWRDERQLCLAQLRRALAGW